MRHLSEETRQHRNAAFLASVVVVERSPSPTSESCDELAERSLAILIKVALEPDTRLVQVYRDLTLHPAEGKRALEDLVARGMVKVHRLVRKGRGGKPQVLEVLAAGVDELKRRGITPVARKLKGGFRHNVYGLAVERWARADGCRHVSFERTLGGKTFDLVLESEELVGVEIVLTASASWNAAQALKAASVAGVTKVIVACEERKLMKGIEQELGSQDALGLHRGKIEMRHLGEFGDG